MKKKIQKKIHEREKEKKPSGIIHNTVSQGEL